MVTSKRSKIGDWVVVFLCFLLILVCLLPLLNIFARSLSASEALIRNEVTLWPIGLNFEAYRMVLSDVKYTWSLTWTALLTVICVFVSLVMTTICAYPLTYRKLKGRRFFSAFIIFTMYFSAGTIPMYLLLNDLKMLNKPVVLIIPYCLNVFYMIIMRSFLLQIPDSLRESAEIDGAGPVRILFQIYLPLSTPVIATLCLFYAVGRWNGFSDALMFMNDRTYYPIQLLLYNIINSISSIEISTQEGFSPPGLSETLKAATIMFATVPILLVYPWLQRYFITGVTLGAIKE
ncbi:MAG: carbohydrate ABC transporter permease [Spirochaetales bacterium]|nr:carbohydrate ABC transporter permease [Spirochaetales bacterium]